ncbi:MAG: tetratricopeptide repeat-containing sensor histidine kinase [Jejuia sp.]
MTKIKFLVILLVSFYCNILISQIGIKRDLFNQDLRNIINQHRDNSNFFNAGLFFIERKWDSTLVYSFRSLDAKESSPIVKDYNHYFRGFALKEKSILKESKKEYNLISEEFDHYSLVKLHLGQIALLESEFKEAVSFFEELIDLKDEDYKYFNKSTVIQNLGTCYIHLKEFQLAEAFLKENVEIKKRNLDTLGLITAYGSVANLYYVQYKDDLAIPYFKSAYDLSSIVEDLEAKIVATLNMAVVEENRKNFSKALVYRKEYEKWKDALNDQNKIYQVAQLEKEFAVKQKQQEVNLLEAENEAKEQERNGLLYSALTLLILLGITFYFYKEKNKANKIVSAQKEKLDELNSAKDKLFSIVSHDLRSSVNALKASNTKLLDSLESKNLKALESIIQNNSSIVNSAYSLLDNLLHWALLQTKQSYFHVEQVSLFFIVEQVTHNYKSIMYDKGLSFENLVVKTDKVFADQESLKIILRNLMDNAIKFSEAEDTIKIYSENSHNQYCDLIVEDSGCGINEANKAALLENSELLTKTFRPIKGTGLGLQLCKSYIKKNHGKFSIESEPRKGTKMIVSLPKREVND